MKGPSSVEGMVNICSLSEIFIYKVVHCCRTVLTCYTCLMVPGQDSKIVQLLTVCTYWTYNPSTTYKTSCANFAAVLWLVCFGWLIHHTQSGSSLSHPHCATELMKWKRRWMICWKGGKGLKKERKVWKLLVRGWEHDWQSILCSN